jgi:hypothetical protein
MSMPVIAEDSSDTRKRTAWATSDASVNRRRAESVAAAARTSSDAQGPGARGRHPVQPLATDGAG